MIDYELYCRIKDYHDHRQLTVAQIARELHLDQRTVARWLAAEKFQLRQVAARPSKLDPYKKQIVRWLESHPYTAAQIFLRLREAGYTGGMPWNSRPSVASTSPTCSSSGNGCCPNPGRCTSPAGRTCWSWNCPNPTWHSTRRTRTPIAPLERLMNRSKNPKGTPDDLRRQLQFLKLPFILEHFEELAHKAGAEQWSHVEYLARLVEGEAALRQDRARQRRIKQARFPVLKTLPQFDFTWPTKINRLQVQNLFRLKFIEDQANAILIGGVGLGKTHLAIALGWAACQAGPRVRFATAIDIINSLSAAQNAGRLVKELKQYTRPELLIIDELGYLPIDKRGADLLFQIISHRYERGSIVLTTNKVYKHWPSIFNNDSTLTSAILDRVLHHAETLVLEGKSYRMKDRIEP